MLSLFPDGVVRLAVLAHHEWVIGDVNGMGCLHNQMFRCVNIYRMTSDLERRWNEHSGIQGAKYTGAHRAVQLLWTEPHMDKESAEKRETQIKRWTRRKKLALASGDPELLKKL